MWKLQLHSEMDILWRFLIFSLTPEKVVSGRLKCARYLCHNCSHNLFRITVQTKDNSFWFKVFPDDTTLLHVTRPCLHGALLHTVSGCCKSFQHCRIARAGSSRFIASCSQDVVEGGFGSNAPWRKVASFELTLYSIWDLHRLYQMQYWFRRVRRYWPRPLMHNSFQLIIS